MTLKRASYRDGVDFIAMNDEPHDLDVEQIASYTTVVLMAQLFGTTEEKIAADILRIRRDA